MESKGNIKGSKQIPESEASESNAEITSYNFSELNESLHSFCQNVASSASGFSSSENESKAFLVDGTIISANNALTRLDELGTFIESISASKDESSKSVNKLMEHSKKLLLLFQRIDMFEAYLKEVEEVVTKAEKKVDEMYDELKPHQVRKIFSNLLGDIMKKEKEKKEWGNLDFMNINTELYFNS